MKALFLKVDAQYVNSPVSICGLRCAASSKCGQMTFGPRNGLSDAMHTIPCRPPRVDAASISRNRTRS